MKEFQEFKVWIKLKSEIKRMQSSSVSKKSDSIFKSLSASQMNVSKVNPMSKPQKKSSDLQQNQSYSPTKKFREI